MHEVLVNHLGCLSLSRKSVVRLTDHPNMTLDVFRGPKTTTQQQLNLPRLALILHRQVDQSRGTRRRLLMERRSRVGVDRTIYLQESLMMSSCCNACGYRARAYRDFNVVIENPINHCLTLLEGPPNQALAELE